MYAVGTLIQTVDPEDSTVIGKKYPVAFEDDDACHTHASVTSRLTREKAQAVADALNVALVSNPD